MGHILLCVLGFFWLDTHFAGCAEVSRPTVTLQPNWSVVFRGETVTLRCEIQDDGGRTQWNYEWSPANRNAPTSSEYRISSVSESDSGNYWCEASGGHQNTDWSFPFRLTVRCKSDLL
ncbi:high affinity immunoglobulin gamma Fc receptor IB-like [Poecilia reticulata]|uniref:high affinity immunoglobulin gamma Fc receptor IB-like n=1 Tax=Poecilia reticulata TaxID=8081 RepID=UPI0007EB6E35|nr:PREDICTED: high affinity immunoglobulin gamma Fc receptor IB-like [Poecilia reticulata]